MSVASGETIGGDWASVKVDGGTASDWIWISGWWSNNGGGVDSVLFDVAVGSGGTTVSGDILIGGDGLSFVIQSKGLANWLWNTVI